MNSRTYLNRLDSLAQSHNKAVKLYYKCLDLGTVPPHLLNNIDDIDSEYEKLIYSLHYWFNVHSKNQGRIKI